MGVKEEKARQTCFCFTKTGRQLAPVKPSRCSHIWDDLQAFSKRLTKSEHEIAALKKAADGALERHYPACIDQSAIAYCLLRAADLRRR